jgi:predicted nucleotidyltransferase
VSAEAVGEQSDAAVEVIRGALAHAQILGLYLYGSAAAGGLRPDSDLDLFVVTDRRVTATEKARIVDGLLPISDRKTRPPAWRPIEVTIVAQPEVRPWRYPARMELQFGEWLRDALVSGAVEPEPPENPDLAVLITMVRQTSRALIGPPTTDVLDAVPRADLERAMLDGLPSLMSDLADDTRNVLLTLARIWTTVATEEIRSKDEAADWVLSRLPEADRPTLARARDLYRAGGYGDPWDEGAVRSLAERLVSQIMAAARQSDGRHQGGEPGSKPTTRGATARQSSGPER